HKRKSSNLINFIQTIQTKDVIELACFLSFGLAVLMISFFGKTNEPRTLILKEYAKERIVAEFPFSYTSDIATEEKAKLIRAKTPPIFDKDQETYQNFSSLIDSLDTAYDTYKSETSKIEDASKPQFTEYLTDQIDVLQLEDFEELDFLLIDNLFANTSTKDRSKLFKACLTALGNLHAIGIYDQSINGDLNGQNILFSISEAPDNLGTSASPLVYEDALATLKKSISDSTKDEDLAQTLLAIFELGLRPNLVFNESKTKTSIEQALKAMEPEVYSYEQGDTLIAPGQPISLLEIEKIKAYELAEDTLKGDNLFFNELFIKRSFLTLLLLIIAYLIIHYSLKESPKRNTTLAVSAVSIILNLIVFRFILEFGSILLNNNEALTAVLPNLLPIALAPILTAVLVGSMPGILTALIISVLFCLGFDNSLEQFLITFLPGIIGVYSSFKIRNRSKLIQAGLYTGLTSALCATIISLLNDSSIAFISQQIICSTLVGFITGITVVGLLSTFEQIFKITTSITLLELTDFNHPILRKMQLEAPGTYHHSLMVANLSENAAAIIGSNPLLCRVCCLFHDIGKLVKPEYFSENQRGFNPHEEKNPSMSALVIKAHVKEGVGIAKQEKLPKVIIDVIKQHHGTSLIKYFYHQAQKQLNAEALNNSNQAQEGQGKHSIHQSTYRYDGPKPRFKESAIIFFADAVEAASRSLKKISQPSIEEMIDSIFESRIKDGQLDECPLTFKELDAIKESFTRTLLNMLHSRIEYPTDSEIESNH
ncbi:MAG: HDIG domain-containing protein, partial [Verrucomicrobia bacterium]|nr:HDIG domain-containing protein [Verrucomicrobiota bacterium]